MLRGIALVRYYVVTAAAWRHDKIYRSIKKVLKTKKVKRMTFEKGLKYAIQQNRYKILRKLGVSRLHITVGDESESKINNILERDILGAESLFFFKFNSLL